MHTGVVAVVDSREGQRLLIHGVISDFAGLATRDHEATAVISPQKRERLKRAEKRIAAEKRGGKFEFRKWTDVECDDGVPLPVTRREDPVGSFATM